MSDDDVLRAQLGRRLKAPADVVARCHLGLPIVSRVPAHLDDGTPFPTSYWLSCPLARRRIGRLEGRGAVKDWDEKIAGDEALQREMADVHARYPSGRGVGGSPRSVKCLHAHAALVFAGGESPPGQWAVDEVTPLICESPCVENGEVNAAWRPRSDREEDPREHARAARDEGDLDERA